MELLNPDIQTIARRVAAEFDPERIILFGSTAEGRADADSDLDLLVVMRSSGRAVEQALAIRRFLKSRRPMDLLVRNPEGLQRRIELGDWFLRDIVERGVVLYERPEP